jgi:hypothetical protein
MSPDRLLALAVWGLPPRRAAWGAAMRAELAAIDDPAARRRFARSAAAAAFVAGFGVCVAVALGAAVLVGAITLAASRAQMDAGGPGVLSVTVPAPALALLAVAAASAFAARSLRFGMVAGYLAVAASFVALATVVGLEGLVWMDRHGVFMIDGDPPRQVIGDVDVLLDLFTTGLWIPHLMFWLPCASVGALIGARLGRVTDEGRSR